MFCGQTLEEGSPARNSPRPLCPTCQERSAQGQRLCPACRETVQAGAALCHFCQTPLLPGAAGEAAPVSPYAVASLASGIFGMFFCGIPAILAIIFGSIALKEIRKSGGATGGTGMAKWGRGLGIAWLTVIFLVMALSFLGGFLSAGGGH
jgi:hypothetical protein